MENTQIRRAVRFALGAAATATVTQIPFAFAQDQSESVEPLSEVVVTGTRIRRVDLETASPVYVLDADSISEAGVATLGDLIQNAPVISGAATNPQVNNGGGTGESNVELRGLGVNRTLVLLNGRRIGGVGSAFLAADVNAIPANMIERVEILKEGAGAIYGSDAVAGVVNFITRRNFDGAELSYDYGITSESDGERQQVNLAWGTNNDTSRVLLGANYNKQEEVFAGAGDFSRFALYLYGTYGVFPGGSSRTPTGRIDIPGTSCGSGSVTLVAGQNGDSPGDYRCFVPSQDRYNFQPVNLLLTPQERTSVFALADTDIAGGVNVYAEFLHNNTSSGYQIAPLPFDARQDDVVIAANNVFNPFGIAFGGGDGVNPNAQWRMEALGNRSAKYESSTDEVRLGARGPIGSTSWQWDAAVQYGNLEQDAAFSGYLFKPGLQAAFGPNFLDAQGVVRCGTPGNIVPNCTPVNIFNVNDPSQADALRSIAAGYNTNYSYTTKIATANLNGNVFELPAGDVKLAVGAEYRDQDLDSDTDSLSEALPPDYLVCQLANEACGGDTRGGYDVKEVFAEAFVPILKDRPGVKALNATIGTRYSDYSNFGNTTNSVIKLEYRPVSDVLIRGSFAEVFRAPTLYDLYRAPASTSSQFNDPCIGLTTARVAASPNLALVCQNVPRDGSYTQPNSQITGLLLGNPDLQAEAGEVLTYGVVYEPRWLSGFSATVDLWDYKLDDTITPITPETVASQCEATGEAQYCGLISRFPDGSVQQLRQPSVNLGKLETSGVDVGLRYRLRDTPVGNFQLSLDTTYIDKYDSTPVAGAATTHVAGTYDRQYGNYARWRARGSVGWRWRDFSALGVVKYFHKIELVDPDGAPGIQPSLAIPSYTYIDLSLGYTFREKLQFQLGAQNLADKQPPLLYNNNVLNANTDVSTYDTVGRFFWGRVTYRF